MSVPATEATILRDYRLSYQQREIGEVLPRYLATEREYLSICEATAIVISKPTATRAETPGAYTPEHIKKSMDRLNELREILIEEASWNSQVEETETAVKHVLTEAKSGREPEISITDDFGYYVKWKFSEENIISLIYSDFAKVTRLDKKGQPIEQEKQGALPGIREYILASIVGAVG